MKTLALEERKSAEAPWQPYDPTLMEIKLTFWVPGIIKTHFSLNEYSEQMCRKIRVPRDIKMAEFKKTVETKFEILDAVLMKRTPLM